MYTREKLIALRKGNPELKLRDLANLTGVSKQRVSAILQEEGLPTRGTWERKSHRLCTVCGKRTPNGQMVCPGECRNLYMNVLVNCTTCDELFSIPRKQFVRQVNAGKDNFFHSRECFYTSRKKSL